MASAERRSLAELNIPFFAMNTGDGRIFDADGHVADSALEPGFNRVSKNISSLSNQEIERQVDIIRISLAGVRHVQASLVARRARAVTDVNCQLEESDAIFSDRARKIADQLADAAYRGSSSAAWIGLDWLQDSTVCQISPLGADLYNGAVGVSLFLAAHAKTNRDARSAELAMAGIAAVRSDLLGHNAARTARALGIGGIHGLSSIIYGFTAIAEFIQDQGLLNDATAISQLITAELIAHDSSLDLMDGTSGALLALIKLHRATKSEIALSAAHTCARHLLSAEVGNASGGLMASGLSHGPAGLALALAKWAPYATAAEQTRLKGTAMRWLAMENAMFCTEHRNWRDARSETSQDDEFWPCQWCHGAAGVGLARIEIARSGISSSEVYRDILRAVDCTIGAWPYATDSLCCGSLGGIELLAEASAFLNARALRKRSRARLLEVVQEADRHGDYLWDAGSRQINIGLFRGVTGVGYSLLRQIDPTLPNVLVLA